MTPEARARALALFDQERRHPVASDGRAMDTAPAIVRLGPPGRAFHAIIYTCFDVDDAEAIIEREIARYADIGADFEWKVYAHDAPSDLLQRLELHGLVVGPMESVLVYDLSATGQPGCEPPSDATVVRVDSVSRFNDYQEVVDGVFGKSAAGFHDEIVQSLADPSQRHRAYVVYADGKPVSAGRLSALPGSAFGGLWGGATREPHRRRGYYRALVGVRAQDALALGLRYLVVDALPTSRPTLERLGFERVTDTWPCEWRAGARATHR